MFIVGDPSDSNTMFKYQQAFAAKLRAAGHDVTVVEAEAEATGPQHDGLVFMANRALGWCNAGFDSERIGALVRSKAPALRAAKQKPAEAEPR